MDLLRKILVIADEDRLNIPDGDYGNYEPYFWIIVIFIVLSLLLLSWLWRRKCDSRRIHSPAPAIRPDKNLLSG